MNPGTVQKLRELKNYPWFSRAGTSTGRDLDFGLSWDEAIAEASRVEWSNVQLEGKNQLTRNLSHNHRQRFRQWNRIVEEVKAAQEQIFSGIIIPLAREKALPKSFENTVRWDLLCICMEVEFADIVPPCFYNRLDHCYETGHFPCGWEGDYPQGRLLVF